MTVRFRYFKVDVSRFDDSYFVRESYPEIEQGTGIVKVDLRNRILSLLDLPHKDYSDPYCWDVIIDNSWNYNFRIKKDCIILGRGSRNEFELRVIEELSENKVSDILKYLSVVFELES